MKMETVSNWFHSLPIAGIENKVLTMLWANNGLILDGVLKLTYIHFKRMNLC